MSDHELQPDRFGPWTAARLAKIPQYKQMIVESLRAGMWLSEISEQIGVGTKAIATWRQQDRVFAEEYQEAEDAFVDTLDREAHRRAFEGTTDVIVHAGRIVMDPRVAEGEEPRPLLRRTFSDSLTMFILKGRRRDVYGDKVETDNKHSINFDDAKARLAEKLRALQSRGTPVAPDPSPAAEPGTAAEPGPDRGAPGEPDA